jgi:hypothetical protein
VTIFSFSRAISPEMRLISSTLATNSFSRSSRTWVIWLDIRWNWSVSRSASSLTAARVAWLSGLLARSWKVLNSRLNAPLRAAPDIWSNTAPVSGAPPPATSVKMASRVESELSIDARRPIIPFSKRNCRSRMTSRARVSAANSAPVPRPATVGAVTIWAVFLE